MSLFKLPLQTLELQASDEGPEQSVPPLSGAGLLHCLVLVPPAQLTLQVDHPPQEPSSIATMK